jgi:hypothetical protein
MPVFMRHDPPAALYYGRGHIDRCLDFVLAAAELATRSRGRAVCRSHSATALRGCTELPDGGWDAVIRWARDDRLAGAI